MNEVRNELTDKDRLVIAMSNEMIREEIEYTECLKFVVEIAGRQSTTEDPKKLKSIIHDMTIWVLDKHKQGRRLVEYLTNDDNDKH